MSFLEKYHKYTSPTYLAYNVRPFVKSELPFRSTSTTLIQNSCPVSSPILPFYGKSAVSPEVQVSKIMAFRQVNTSDRHTIRQNNFFPVKSKLQPGFFNEKAYHKESFTLNSLIIFFIKTIRRGFTLYRTLIKSLIWTS